MPYNIGFLLPSSQLYGGVKFVLNLARRLHRLPGFAVRVFCPEPPPLWCEDPPPFVVTDLASGDFGDADLLVTTYYDQREAVEFWGKHKRLFQLCQGYEGDYLEYFVPPDRARALRREIEAYYSLPYPKLAVSGYLQQRLKAFGAPVHYLGQGLEEGFWCLRPASWREKVYLTVVGRYDYPFKGVSESLALALRLKERFPGLKILRISPVDTRAKEKIFPVDEYRIGVRPADMPRFYRLSRLTFYWAEREGFGLPFIESLAAFTPVIARDNPAFRSFCRSRYPLFSSPEEALRFASDLLANPELYWAWARRGRRLIRPFRWRSVVRRFLQALLRETLRRR